MSASFLSEAEIACKVDSFLSLHMFKIVQLVYPGGQCRISITYEHNKKNKIIYPDLIAIKGNHILIGEIKQKFSQHDYSKIFSYITSPNFKNRLEEVLSRYQSLPPNLSYSYALIHSQPYQPQNLIYQIIFSREELEIVPPSGNYPLNFLELFAGLGA